MAVTKAPARKTKLPAAKKPATTATKSAVKKVSSAPKTTKVATSKFINSQVPVKENIDMVQNVLSIKAHNDEVKQAKQDKKASKAQSKTAPKAIAERSKSKAVKDTAQKAAAQKFAATKETQQVTTPKACCCCCGIKKGFLGAWARAYKNIFNFKGRTSRYEYWAYVLFNMFFAFLLGASSSFIEDRTGQPCVWCERFSTFMMIVWGVVAISITVRRLHDCGYPAWKGFFRPMIAWCILLFALAIVSEKLQLDNAAATQQYSILSFTIGSIAIVAVLAMLYYSVKTCLVSGYYEEENADNEFGAVAYNDACYKKHGIRYMSLFWCIITVIALVYIAYMTNIAMAILAGVAG